MFVNHQKIILHLSLIKNIGPSVLLPLIELLGVQRLSDVYSFSAYDFVALGCSQKVADLLVTGLSDQSVLHKELELMDMYHVKFLTVLCEKYPILLKSIHVPPVILYYQGDVNLFDSQKNIACVGARKANRYVYDALMQIVVPMIHDEWVVVSGGALGADTFAHQIALDQKGKTIVVVGSGLCHQYPPSNRLLFEKIIAQGGLIVSVFSMNTIPEPWNFPQRNRIISGMSRGCLVLQAAVKSGALITAECALEQGREVFALPGSIFDPLSAGCHLLIGQGAKLVTNAQDILEEFGYTPKVDSSENNQQQVLNFVSNSKIDSCSDQILQIAVMPVTADFIMSKLQLDMDTLQSKLFELSLDSKITQDAMGFWVRL